jgi:endogenous inhibitor of DNA gyrase (YacG/DUF329 family)
MTISGPMDENPTPAPTRPCLHCGKPAVSPYRPFCSARCANIDLGRWLNGDYRIPANEADEESGDEEPRE